MILVILIVYGKLELKPLYSRGNKNSYLINTILNILIVYVVIDIVEDITGLNTTLVVTVLYMYIHCIELRIQNSELRILFNIIQLCK